LLPEKHLIYAKERRETINGDDIIWAVTTLGFEDFIAPLQFYLSKYREIEGEKQLTVPKQQRMEQQRLQQHHHQQEQEQEQNMILPYTNVYSSSDLTSQPPSFMTADHQPFPLPFSPNSILKHLQLQNRYMLSDLVSHSFFIFVFTTLQRK
jgi:nuclear transcription Y subunit beta